MYALRDPRDSSDPVDRCGVYPLALPVSLTPDELLIACKTHDFMYSSPAYQLFNSREESDSHLTQLGEQGNIFSKLLSVPFYFIARALGRAFWENKKTR